jgi:hypothetical protein
MNAKLTTLFVGAATLVVAVTAANAAPIYYDGYQPAKNSYGQPDLTGTWSNATTTDVVRPARFGDRLILTEEEAAELENEATTYRAAGDVPTDPDAPPPSDGNTNLGYNRGWTDPGTTVMRVGGRPRSSILTTPDGQVPPRLPSAIAAADEGPSEFSAGTRPSQNDNPEGRGLPERCIHMPTTAGPAVRSVLYNNNYRIQQGRDAVAIWVEMIHDVKVIRLNGEHGTVREWLGDSIGWYEGDTLVVETINFHPLQTFYGADENLKVTERFTRVSPDRLHYEFIVEDPTVWAEPWGGEYEFWASPGIYEYACHEGNYGLENILAGARAEDAEAAARAEEPVAAR